MIIVVNKVFPEIELELTFTKEEQEHGLFKTVNEEISNELQLKEVSEKQIITQKVGEDEDLTAVLGQLVDKIRMKYCGDITSHETVVESDLQDCPCFKLGAVDEKPVEEIKFEELIGEPIIEEDIIKEEVILKK